MKGLSIVVFFAIILTVVSGECQSQQNWTGLVEIGKIDLGYVRNSSSERVLSMGSNSYSRDRWAKIEVSFSIKADFIPQIEFRYYLLMKNRRSMLTGTQTCMYVKKGKWLNTCIYVYPNAAEMYGGGIVGVAVAAYFDGKLVALRVTGEKRQRWWETLEAIPAAMVNWHMTPFDRRGVDRYEQLKPQ